MAYPCLIALTVPLLPAHLPGAAAMMADPAPAAVAKPSLEAPASEAPEEAAPTLPAFSLAASLAAPQDSEPDPAEEPAGEIIVQGEYGPPKGDPIEAVNEASYRLTQQLDEALVEPIAYAYRDGLPRPIRDGLGNVVRNIGEPNNALNFLLQGKIGKTFETLGRLLINSTIGVGGLFDIAKRPGVGLPYRRNGWANTMGFYGIGPGPYLYLPVTGATSARDVTGSGLDQLLLPIAVGKPFNRLAFALPYFTINSLDARLEVDEELKRIDQTIDPYAARRDTYLYRRARAIAELKGEEPPPPPAILEEVEGTGDFADGDPAPVDAPSEPGAEPEPPPPGSSSGGPLRPNLVITRPR